MVASRSLRTRSPRGFTLIEILVVIAIIGMLMSLSGFAAFQALKNVKEKAIIAEIGRLNTAMESYHEQRNGYPPCMGAIVFGGASQPALPKNSFYMTRQQMTTAHTQAGYNGFNFTTGSLKTATISANVYTYNYYNLTPVNTVVKLDLDTMGPSEALVFWLGGFPCPYINGTYIAPKKLIGFAKNPTNPYTLTYSTTQATMSVDQFMQSRTTPLFDFDESRLYDSDNDGWYEYYPEKPDFTTSPPTAPYVYFDANLYTRWRLDLATPMAPMTPFPAPQSIIPNKLNVEQQFALTWGLAMPYAKSVVGTTITWVNPQSFQIIAPGFDHMYSSTSLATSNAATSASINMNPATMVPRVLQDSTITNEERDNFTNFSDQTLGDEASYRATTAATGS